jgi:tetratricopeptide (TPR) repeat protein
MSFSRAIDHLERARSLDPTLTEVALDLALARFGLVDYEAARREFTAYVAAAGQDAAPERRATAHRHLAILARLDGDLGDAREALDRAAALSPRDPDLPYERGLIEEASGAAEAALGCYAAALELERNHLPSHFRRARLLRTLGREEEAKRAERIHRALQSLFDDSTGRDLKDPRQRAQAWGEIATLDPQNRNARFEHGRALLELGRDGEAALLVDALIRDFPGYFDAHAFGIDLALRRRDRADAVRRVHALRAALPTVTREQLPAEMRPLWESP